MAWDNCVIDPRAMSCRCHDTAERLVRDGADVRHGKAILRETPMQHMQRDAGLDDDVFLVDIDLKLKTDDQQMIACDAPGDGEGSSRYRHSSANDHGSGHVGGRHAKTYL